MKFGITINIGNFNSLRCESTDCETKAECYEEVLFIISDWGNFDAVNWWRDKIKEKLKGGPKEEPTIIKHSPGFEDYKPSAPTPMTTDDRYNYLGKDGHPYTCNKCNGLISWDKHPDVRYPIHVDKEGKIIGDGSCPDFG